MTNVNVVNKKFDATSREDAEIQMTEYALAQKDLSQRDMVILVRDFCNDIYETLGNDRYEGAEGTPFAINQSVAAFASSVLAVFGGVVEHGKEESFAAAVSNTFTEIMTTIGKEFADKRKSGDEE